MHGSRTSRITLALVLAACLGACGDDADRTTGPAAGLDGPPMHEVTRTTLPTGARGMSVRAQAPCLLTLAVEGLDSDPPELPMRRLAAGEDTRIWWAEEIDSGARPVSEPSLEDAAAGRTSDVAPRLNFAFEDMPILGAGIPFFMRPGTPQHAVWDYRAPVRPEALPFGTELELCTFAVGELREGKLRVLPGAGRSRVAPDPAGVLAPDQVRVLRLVLRVDRAP